MREFRDNKETSLRGPKEFTAKIIDGGVEFYYQGHLTFKYNDEITGLCKRIELLANGWNVVWA
ncbi:MAG: hypothetical protein ACRC62_02215 [Microcoleus sp.]